MRIRVPPMARKPLRLRSRMQWIAACIRINRYRADMTCDRGRRMRDGARQRSNRAGAVMKKWTLAISQRKPGIGDGRKRPAFVQYTRHAARN